jgi:hypothetical protein
MRIATCLRINRTLESSCSGLRSRPLVLPSNDRKPMYRRQTGPVLSVMYFNELRSTGGVVLDRLGAV